MTGAQTVLLIIGLEHVMLLLKLLISAAIPDIPQHVALELAKVEHNRREVDRLISQQRLAELQVSCEVWTGDDDRDCVDLHQDGQQGLSLSSSH